MPPVGQVGGHPLQVIGQQPEHQLRQGHELPLLARSHLAPLPGKGPQSPGGGLLPLQPAPGPADLVPGPSVHHPGDGPEQFPLEEHHRLQRLLPEHPVWGEPGQKRVLLRQSGQHILQAPHRADHLGVVFHVILSPFDPSVPAAGHSPGIGPGAPFPPPGRPPPG